MAISPGTSIIESFRKKLSMFTVPLVSGWQAVAVLPVPVQ
jgi:hypothetical protein